jgi:hypothetical protein
MKTKHITLILITSLFLFQCGVKKKTNKPNRFIRSDSTASYTRHSYGPNPYLFRSYGSIDDHGNYVKRGHYSNNIHHSSNVGSNSFKSTNIPRGGFGSTGRTVSS